MFQQESIIEIIKKRAVKQVGHVMKVGEMKLKVMEVRPDRGRPKKDQDWNESIVLRSWQTEGKRQCQRSNTSPRVEGGIGSTCAEVPRCLTAKGDGKEEEEEVYSSLVAADARGCHILRLH